MTKLLTQMDQKICTKILEGEDSIHKQRAKVLLLINDGITQQKAGEQSGLTIGQVRYCFRRYKTMGIEIFPEDIRTMQEAQSKMVTKEQKDDIPVEETAQVVKTSEESSKEEKPRKVKKKDKKLAKKQKKESPKLAIKSHKKEDNSSNEANFPQKQKEKKASKKSSDKKDKKEKKVEDTKKKVTKKSKDKKTAKKETPKKDKKTKKKKDKK